MCFPPEARLTPSSSKPSRPLSLSEGLSDALFDLRLDFLSRLLRFFSRRFSFLLERLCLSLLDLFLFLRLSSLDELISESEDTSESESLSDSEDSVSLSVELSDSDV